MKKITSLVCSLFLMFSFLAKPISVFAADPVVTINSIETADSIPTITGTIDNPEFSVLVTCDFLNALANVDENGDWNIVAPGVVPDGTYAIYATAYNLVDEATVGETIEGTLTVLDDFTENPTVDLPPYANAENQKSLPINGQAEPESMIVYYIFDKDGNSVFNMGSADSNGNFEASSNVSSLADGPLKLLLYSVDSKENQSETLEETIIKDTVVHGEIVTPVPLHGNDYNPPITLNIENGAFWRIDYDYGNLAMGWGTGEDQTVELLDLPIGNYTDLMLLVADSCDNVKYIPVPEFNLDSFGVDAGPDITTDEPVQITAIVTPDQGIQSVLWEQVSGPGTITFDPNNALTTTVSADQVGEYVLRINVFGEGENCTGSDEVKLTWTEEETPPVNGQGGDTVDTSSLVTFADTIVTPEALAAPVQEVGTQLPLSGIPLQVYLLVLAPFLLYFTQKFVRAKSK